MKSGKNRAGHILCLAENGNETPTGAQSSLAWRRRIDPIDRDFPSEVLRYRVPSTGKEIIMNIQNAPRKFHSQLRDVLNASTTVGSWAYEDDEMDYDDVQF